MKKTDAIKSMFYHGFDLHGKLDKKGKLTKTGKQVVLYEVYDGFGIPVRVLDLVSSVEIHYENEVYNATPADFEKHGVEHTFTDPKTLRREEQLILPRKYWRSERQAKLL